MAKRYQNIKSQKTSSGKVGYLPSIYPTLEPSNNDYYIITREEDRMDLIANDFYGDPTLWWVIAMANDLPGDSFFPPRGFQLRIPGNATNAISKFNEENSDFLTNNESPTTTTNGTTTSSGGTTVSGGAATGGGGGY